MYRSPSPYASPPEALYNASPYTIAAPASPYMNSASPSPQSTQITPGSITYTTSTTADGKIIYHPFKAVPASYQTPSGIVSGIQWVPAEATQILPPGAQPASTDFAEAWNQGNLSKEDKSALKEWQRAEDKRRRKEEKESAKVLREKERQTQARFDEDALRYAREQDAVTRERRRSFNQSAPFPGAPGTPAPAGNIYAPSSPYQGYVAPLAAATTGYTRERKYSTGGGILSDLDNQFNTMGIADRDHITGPGLSRPRKYSNADASARPLSAYGTAGAHSPNIGSTYAPPPRPLSRNSGYAGGHSPNPGAAPLPYAGAPPPRPHSRNASVSGTYPSYTNPSPGLKSAEPAGGAFVPHAPRPSSPYASANYPPANAHVNDPYARGSSPFAPPAALPPDVYPPGHILEGQPIPRSRATTPIPGTAPAVYPFTGAYPQTVGGRPVSPHPPPAGAYPQTVGGRPVSPHPPPTGAYPQTLGGRPVSPHPPPVANPPAQQLAAPECFSRPINGAHPYTPFGAMKIQDMNDFFDSIPRMPAVLQPHDVYPEDWARLTEATWSGRLPVPTAPGSQPPKRATVTASLVDLWNYSFFNRRGVELVLYKGTERRSGPNAGVVDLHHHIHDDADLSDTESSEEDDHDDDDDEMRYNAAYGAYGGRPGYAPDMAEIRQKRLAAKAERKRRRKEKKSRQRAREREKKYTLYLTCIPQQSATGHPIGAVPSPAVPSGYGGAPFAVGSGYVQGGSIGHGAYGGGI
ncbi:hypothetical protein L218DRAFT_1077171 [Marasmius fiardii PR-910]|nr:hypothetical protein L218DRAFT_1077171 [Marasmius fiardii PR-910]